jgi:hypothetical protein
MKDIGNGASATVAVRYSGSVPDLCKVGLPCRRRRRAPTRNVRRRARLADHEVPVEARAEAERRLRLTRADA